MVHTCVPRPALLLALVAVGLELTAASHFRGAIIQWRPVDPVNFDGRIAITYRVAEAGGNCNADRIADGTLNQGPGGTLACRSGCSETIGDLQYQCTDFSVDENWSAGQGSNEKNLSSVAIFEASYVGGCWIALNQGDCNWEIRVKGNLSPRADSGRINSSPTTAVSPVFRLRHGATHTITIPVSDADGDIVRCRWAESAQGECADVCQVFPATLDQDNCRLTYNANGSLGFYAVAIQVEDFISSSSTVAMSSVPVQFLVEVVNITIPANITPPEFVGTTPVDGDCINVGSTYQQLITARSGGDGATIVEISTVSPPGLLRSDLITGNDSRESYINVTLTSSASQQGANIFCYTATDNFGLISQQRCIMLVVGVDPPQLTSVVLSTFGNGTFALSLQYDQQITMPSTRSTSGSRFVRVFQDDGIQVLMVDVLTSTDVVYSGMTLTITTTTNFFTTRSYYLLADPGVAVAAAFCALESPAVTSPSAWLFGVTVKVPPTLTFFPSAVRDVVRGESLVATCQASGDPPPVVQWFRGDQLLITDGDQSRVSVSQGNIFSNDDVVTSGQLTVFGFTSEDMGVYSCVAVNNFGSDSRSFQVNTVGRPNITSITSNSEEQALFNGGILSLDEFTPQLELTCEAYGVPPPEVVWLQDGITLQNLTDRRVITNGGRLNETGNITTSMLTFTEVQLSDAGDYTCRATSGNVSPSPGTTAWTFTFEVAELDECEPNPCLNGGECVDGVRNYTCNCNVSNNVGSVPIYFTGRNCTTVVDNQEAPSITTGPLSVTVELSVEVTLSCTASGNPTPSIRWYKDNKAIEGPQAVGNTFVIPEATPDERGFYQCEAFSSFGSPSRSTEAALLISGIVQFRIEIVLAGVSVVGSRRKRQTSSSIVEALSLQMVNQPLAVGGNLTATVYSVEAAVDNSSEIIITVSTDSTASPATLTNQLTQPLEQALQEVTDINQQISFAIAATERRDGCPVESLVCGNVDLVTWPETEIGQVASIPCPCGVSDPLIQELRGTRRCGGTYDTGAVWEEPQCDSCLFSNTRLALCQLAEVDNPAQLANILVNVTDNPEEIESADVSLTVGFLTLVANSTEDLQQEEVQRDILSIVSNLQQVSPDELAISQAGAMSSTRIFAIVEMVLNFVEVTPGNPFLFAAPEFGVRVEDPPEDLEEGESFTPNLASLLIQIMNSTAATQQMEEIPELPPAMVTLASAVLTPDNNGTRPRISATVYGRDSLFQQRPSFIASNNLETEIVGSIVVDISLRRNGSVTNIVRPPNSNVVIQNFTKSTLARNNGRNTECQFWNLTADDGFGAWDSRNCRVLRETAEEVDCGCDHLTHFAILLDISPNPGPPDANDVALTWVSYIGTILSVICLTIVIITYLMEKKLRKTVYAKLLINLCFALVGLYVTFFISTFSTSVPVLCGVVSALMHYFFLAVFFWMAAEAIHLHRKLVTVFKPDIESYLAIAMAICWVIPAFIVIFSLAPRYQYYIHPQYCRVHDYSFWIGLLVPFGIIYIMNWIIFILIFTSLLCKRDVRKETSKNGNLRKLKENFMIALGLSLLFGVSWAIGLLASSDLHDAVRYPAEWIFTLTTAFLGVYLFVLYILRSAEARNLWKNWFLCQTKKKAFIGVSSTSTPSKTGLGVLTSTVSSWGKNFKANILRRARKDTSDHYNSSNLERNTASTSANPFSVNSSVGKMADMNSHYAEPSSVFESTAAGTTSPHLAPVEIELVHRGDADGETINEEASLQSASPSEVPEKKDVETESLVETLSFHDSTSLNGFNRFPSENDPSLSVENGEHNVGNMQED